MKKIPSHSIALTFIFIVLVGLVVSYAYLFITLSSMGKNAEGIAVEIKDADAILKIEKENKEKLSTYFIKEGQEAAFISSLESYCESISLKCSTDSLSEAPSETGTTKMLGAVVSADGLLSDIEGFLSHLESSQYPIVIERMFLSRENKEASASSTTWRGVFEVSVPVIVQK